MDDIRPPQNQINNQQNPSAPPPEPQPQYQPQPPETLSPNPYGNSPQVNFNQPKPKRRKLRLLIWLLVIVLLAAGGWFAYQKLTEDKTAAPVTQSKDIQNLNIGLLAPDYSTLYPEWTVSNSYAYLTNSQMFEGLVRYENKSKIVPLLAKDWANPDGNTWVFNLKQDVKFHDGNTMQADDVKYSIEKIKKDDTDFASIFASTIDKVSVKEDYKVEITTNQPDPTLLNKLAFLYVIDADAPKGNEPSLAGTGPYLIKPGTKPTKTDVQMVAYNDYHGGKPTTNNIHFSGALDDETLFKEFNEGKYDIVGPMGIGDTEKAAGATQFVTTEPEVSFLGFNTLKPGPLQKKELREAIRYAIDPVKLGAAQGDKVTPVNQLVPDSIPGYNPAIPAYERDIEKAKALVKKAGYPDGVTLNLSYSTEKAYIDELSSELKEANINLKSKGYEDFNKFLDDFLSGKAEMFTVVYASDILDGLDVYQAVLSGTENYKNPELTKKLEEVGKTVDQQRRLKLLQEAAVIVDEDIPLVPVSTRDSLWLMNKDYDIVQDMPSSFLSVYLYKAQLK